MSNRVISPEETALFNDLVADGNDPETLNKFRDLILSSVRIVRNPNMTDEQRQEVARKAAQHAAFIASLTPEELASYNAMTAGQKRSFVNERKSDEEKAISKANRSAALKAVHAAKAERVTNLEAELAQLRAMLGK